MVKGKPINAALSQLQFLPKRSAYPISKLIKSAVASAKENGKSVEDLIINDITVESAGMLKKYMPRAFGRASLIRRRKSRIKVELGSQKTGHKQKDSLSSDFHATSSSI